MKNKTKLLRLIILFSLCSSSIGCSSTKTVWDKPGSNRESFNSDNYECSQQSRVSWSAGGSGSAGLAMTIGAEARANNQSAELYKMCMQARGYTGREVKQSDIDSQKARFAKLKNERETICNKEEYKTIFNKTSCKTEDLTLEQLADKSLISDSEKGAFSKMRSEVTSVNKRRYEVMRTYGSISDRELALSWEQLISQFDKNALELYEGKKTWGEYNKQSLELNQASIDAKNRIFPIK